MIRMGVIGAGHLGRWHLQNIQKIPDAELVGFYDTDPAHSALIAGETGAISFSSLAQLLRTIDAASIVVPTVFHYETALAAIREGVHIFCEKPFMLTVGQADEVIRRAREKKLIVQVGQIERFNPALTALKNYPIRPLFIESHRLSPFNPRGTDVSVILDLMIHDIDIALSLVDSPVRSIHAAGAPVLTDSIDVANARIQFENGCVANLTASRISDESVRKMQIFQDKTFITVDFLNKFSEICWQADDSGKNPPDTISVPIPDASGNILKTIFRRKITPEKSDALFDELSVFVSAIQNGTPPLVTGEDGRKALDIALKIEQEIQSTLRSFK
ncbi:MAG: Gfo/Idh/MocA family oxidoreductase [Candidatus Neomarinimicrobiota bacterium]